MDAGSIGGVAASLAPIIIQSHSYLKRFASSLVASRQNAESSDIKKAQPNPGHYGNPANCRTPGLAGKQPDSNSFYFGNKLLSILGMRLMAFL